MQKLVFLSLVFLFVIPTLSIADPCVPYSNIAYAIQANGASGTLTKNQGCDNGVYSISSQINVSRGFFSKQITQAANGAFASPNLITAQNFTSSNNDAAFITGDMDPLSLVLYLSSSLSASITTFPAMPLFYNGNTISVQCAVSNANASVTTGAGIVVTATEVTCATADNATLFNYSFSQTAPFTMLAATSIENGTQILSAVINNV
jgi:hypothetical protein